MKSHITLLGALQQTWGGMGLILGASLLLLAFGAAAIARTTPGDPLTAAFTALLFVVFAAALALGGWANLWATHPPMAKRIAALKAMAFQAVSPPA